MAVARGAALALVFLGAGACGVPTPARVVVEDAAVDFGLQDCGGPQAATRVLRLTNVGGAPLRWTASLDRTDVFAIVGDVTGEIGPGESATVTVSARSVPAASNAGDTFAAALSIVTNDMRQASVVVPVRMTARGATLTAHPAEADFGTVPLGAQAPEVPVVVENTGNAPVQIALSSPSGDFTTTWTGAPGAAAVAPGHALLGAALGFKPGATGTAADTVTAVVTGPVCGAPLAIHVKGEGADGLVGVSPGVLDFGQVDCGTSATPRHLTVLNAGSDPFQFSTALGLGGASPYQVSPAAGTVPAKSQVQIVIAAAAVPQTSAVTPGLYDDTLTVTTTALADSPHQVVLRETARGAILSTSGAVAFGRRQVGSSPTQPLVVSNAGNAPAKVTVTGTGAFSGSVVSVPASGNASAAVTYAPDPEQLDEVDTGTLALSTTDPLCAPLPSSTATGTSFDRAAKIAAAGYRTCAIATSGVTYCWGDDAMGQLGDGKTNTSRSYPAPVTGLSNAIALGMGASHSCAIVQGGAVKCWGSNNDGELGDGTTTASSTPVDVSGLADAVSLGAGDYDTFAVRSGGSVVAWGGNSGSLGNGTTLSSTVPVPVTSINDAIAVLGGNAFACAVRSGGGAYCWGEGGEYGALGNATVYASLIPVPVTNLTDAAGASSGASSSYPAFACVLRSGGGAACWGSGGYLGDGAWTSSMVPVDVSGLTDATSVAIGPYLACAVRAGGGVVCWGNLPAPVPGITDAAAIAIGNGHRCVVNHDGTVLCWGDDYYGELGDRGNATQAAPVPVWGFD